ncbi:hypothetical protein [Providencia phage PSTNGR1]|uniref:Recombination endonuclease VII n=1 Tax=Providencia phage PSTNGR1 TaxID=2783542 RepID=A0A873WFS3_9CAUD|nr:hypothetical protein [Providencia phage PSTNGR1]
MNKLKASQIPAVRAKLLADQSGVCVLCKRKPTVPCLDHCHKDGFIRGVLCRGCNALLGKLENNRARYGLSDEVAFNNFLRGVLPYLHDTKMKYDMLHPTFKTEDEKRIARNAAARKRRANGQSTK